MAETAAAGGEAGMVVAFGAAHIDVLTRCEAPAVPGASNPARSSSAPGGVAFNVARNLGRLGVGITLLTALGADRDGSAVRDAASAARVRLVDVPAEATATYHAVLDPDGSLVIGLAAMAAYDRLTPDAVAALLPSDAADLWVIDANLPAATLLWLAAEAERRMIPVAACAVSPAKAVRLRPILKRIGSLFCNRGEATAILAAEDAPGRTVAELAAALQAAGVAGGLVSEGAATLAAWDEREARNFQPLRPTSIRSVNGAGDALVAGVLLGVVRGCRLLEAIPLGLAAAALKLETEAPVQDDLSPALLARRIAQRQAETA